MELTKVQKEVLQQVRGAGSDGFCVYKLHGVRRDVLYRLIDKGVVEWFVEDGDTLLGNVREVK